MKFDVVFSNPPYNRGMDIKILNEIVDISNEVIIVHPSTWLLDLKNNTKSFNDFKNKISDKVSSFELFNGNSIFDIQLFLPCLITHISGTNSNLIDVNFFNQSFCVKNINDVTIHGKDWESLVKPFYLEMKKYFDNNKNIWEYNIKQIDQSKFYCQLAAIRGTPNRSKGAVSMVLDDFYTMVMKNSDDNKGIRQPNLNKPGNPTPTFEFNTEAERDNFIDYLKTDFARFCLSLLKNNGHLSSGEMELIPWLDFTEEWDDDKLFKKFNVSQELQDYIRDFLPDFHGIRK
jgi:hypothetical protein